MTLKPSCVPGEAIYWKTADARLPSLSRRRPPSLVGAYGTGISPDVPMIESIAS